MEGQGAVMLDEIINYVQSLQRQVKFLSMKLATVNPRLDFNMESLLSKDGPLQSIISNGSDINGSVNPLDATLRRTLSMQLPTIDGFGDVVSQIANFWEDDLRSVVQMGFGQNRETTFSSQSFHVVNRRPR